MDDMADKLKVFFGGKYLIYREDRDFLTKIRDDYRMRMLKPDERLKVTLNRPFLVSGLDVVYNGCFYQLADDVPGASTQRIADNDIGGVTSSDLMLAMLDERPSLGTVSEMVHAAKLHKPILAFYLRQKTSYDFDSMYWFPFRVCQQTTQVRWIPYEQGDDVLGMFQDEVSRLSRRFAADPERFFA